MVELSGVSLFYESEGSGPAVLLIPSEGMGAWSWFRQVAAMRRLAQVISYDPRGIGQSQAEDVPEASIKTQADDAAALLAAAGAARATVVGVDSGGFVALQLAADHPELAERLVLIATSDTGRPETLLSDEARALEEELTGADREERVRCELGLQLAPGFTTRNPGLLDTIVGNRRAHGGSDTVEAARRAAAAAWDPGQALGAIAIPALVIAGAEDRYQQAQSVRRLAERLADARLEIIPECGHLPHLERPDMVNRLVMSFVQEESHPAEGAQRWRTAGDGSRLVADPEWEARQGTSQAAGPTQLVPLPKVARRDG